MTSDQWSQEPGGESLPPPPGSPPPMPPPGSAPPPVSPPPLPSSPPPGWAPPSGPPPPPGAAWGAGGGADPWAQPQPAQGSGPGGPPPGRYRPLLRPMNLGDILDGAFRLFVAHWRTGLIVAGVFLVPTQLLGAYMQRTMMGGMGLFDAFRMEPEEAELVLVGDPFEGLLGPLVLAVLALLALPFIAGAMGKVAAAAYAGEEIETGAALGAALRRWWSLLASWVLVHLLEFGPMLAGVALMVAGVALNSPGLVILGVLVFLAGIVAALPLMALFVAVAPAIVVEGLGPLAGMARSLRLMRRRFWPVLGAAVVSGLLSGLIAGVLSFPAQMGALIVGAGRGWPLIAVGGILGNLVALPFVANVATLLYFDSRVRLEGFDLQVRAEDLRAQQLTWGGTAAR